MARSLSTASAQRNVHRIPVRSIRSLTRCRHVPPATPLPIGNPAARYSSYFMNAWLRRMYLAALSTASRFAPRSHTCRSWLIDWRIIRSASIVVRAADEARPRGPPEFPAPHVEDHAVRDRTASKKSVLHVQVKGGRERQLPLPADVEEAIDSYLHLDRGCLHGTAEWMAPFEAGSSGRHSVSNRAGSIPGLELLHVRNRSQGKYCEVILSGFPRWGRRRRDGSSDFSSPVPIAPSRRPDRCVADSLGDWPPCVAGVEPVVGPAPAVCRKECPT